MENTVKFIRVRPGVLVEEGLATPDARTGHPAVTPITVKHYAQLLGRTVTEIRFEDYGAMEPLAILVLSGNPLAPRQPDREVTAAVLCDPEGNGPGHLDIQG